MKLNTLSPTPGSKKAAVRVGRGIGSGLGKTSGKGHKGQKARAGGYHKINFEGGQMPIQRRLPKMGFKSAMKKETDEVTLSEIDRLSYAEVNLSVLQEVGLVSIQVKRVALIASGKITRAVTIKGIRVTKGARLAVEQAGGCVEAD